MSGNAIQISNERLRNANALQKKQLEGDRRREVQNAAIIELQQQQVQIGEEQLRMQKISAMQLQMQTEMQQQSELRKQIQRELKDAVYYLKSDLQKIKSIDNALVQSICFSRQKYDIVAVDLNANRMEEIQDKEYVESILNEVDAEYALSKNKLSDDDKKEHEFWDGVLNTVDARYSEIATLKQRLQQINAPKPIAESKDLPLTKKAWIIILVVTLPVSMAFGFIPSLIPAYYIYKHSKRTANAGIGSVAVSESLGADKLQSIREELASKEKCLAEDFERFNSLLTKYEPLRKIQAPLVYSA